MNETGVRIFWKFIAQDFTDQLAKAETAQLFCKISMDHTPHQDYSSDRDDEFFGLSKLMRDFDKCVARLPVLYQALGSAAILSDNQHIVYAMSLKIIESKSRIILQADRVFNLLQQLRRQDNVSEDYKTNLLARLTEMDDRQPDEHSGAGERRNEKG